MVYKFFDKNSTGGGVNIPLEFNEHLAEELHKPLIRKFAKRKVYSRFKDVLLIFLVNMLGLFL